MADSVCAAESSLLKANTCALVLDMYFYSFSQQMKDLRDPLFVFSVFERAVPCPSNFTTEAVSSFFLYISLPSSFPQSQ